MLLVIMAGIVFAISSMMMTDDSIPDSQPWHDPARVKGMGERFVVYKNLLQNFDSNNPAQSPGPVADGDVGAPASWNFPGFHHEAYKDANGWFYVWSETPGQFYHSVLEASDYSMSLCHVLTSRQCVRSSSTTAMLAPAEVPAYIDTGSTVYAWRH